jgi:hypothetical protein
VAPRKAKIFYNFDTEKLEKKMGKRPSFAEASEGHPAKREGGLP